MAGGYIVLALVLALTLNAGNRWVRAAGTGLAALGLAMIALSIVLADVDGTFAAYRPAGRLAALTPTILNAQALLGLLAAIGLVVAGWRQTRRRAVAPLGLANTEDRFGWVSRLAHWTTAVLVLCLVPIGLFVAVLPAGSTDRAGFLAAHQALGLLVIPLAALRLAWLLASPPPPAARALPAWQRHAASATHVGLYALILAFPVSGYWAQATPPELFGWGVPLPPGAPSPTAALIHNGVLPFAFYSVIALHLGAVLKHHLLDRRVEDIRRMVR